MAYVPAYPAVKEPILKPELLTIDTAVEKAEVKFKSFSNPKYHPSVKDIAIANFYITAAFVLKLSPETYQSFKFPSLNKAEDADGTLVRTATYELLKAYANDHKIPLNGSTEFIEKSIAIGNREGNFTAHQNAYLDRAIIRLYDSIISQVESYNIDFIKPMIEASTNMGAVESSQKIGPVVYRSAMEILGKSNYIN